MSIDTDELGAERPKHSAQDFVNLLEEALNAEDHIKIDIKEDCR